ncbi:hypothetical protein KY290_010771 [Solanum tuberosum]|uniref:Secreted protein n=1 Tax=Solanum tuberosum TaxID=4113 RepID=A0ABQ7VYP2_SOLTU|nr:hypothetical protein KY290_010771 [Solanum tuberosum]
MRLRRVCRGWLLLSAAAVRNRWFLVAHRSKLLFTGEAALERRERGGDGEGRQYRGRRGSERRGEQHLLLFSLGMADSDGWLPHRIWRTEKRRGGREEGGVRRI